MWLRRRFNSLTWAFACTAAGSTDSVVDPYPSSFMLFMFLLFRYFFRWYRLEKIFKILISSEDKDCDPQQETQPPQKKTIFARTRFFVPSLFQSSVFLSHPLRILKQAAEAQTQQTHTLPPSLFFHPFSIPSSSASFLFVCQP